MRRSGALCERTFELSFAVDFLAGDRSERGKIRQAQSECRVQRCTSDSLRLQ